MSEHETVIQPPPARADAFGEVAVRLGFVSEAQLQEAVAAQSVLQQAGLPKRIGEVLLEKNLITSEQLDTVVRSQTVSKKRLGDYELISKLGEGGMGAVFKARQLSMDRLVALKILSPHHAGNAEFRERFEREARAIAKLNHPNIVTGIDAGEADGYSFFAMEYVDGETLGQYLRRKGGKLPEREALLLIKQIAQALKHAHANNLLHRDVKPDNILIDKRLHVAKLADLGLARDAQESKAGATKSGQAMGTPFYMSPEQARGLDLTPATDLYSLGATLYHLLAGRIPFPGSTGAVIMARHIQDPVQDPRELEPSISKRAASLVLKCLRKQPADRFRNADEMLAAIDAILAAQPNGRDEAEKVPTRHGKNLTPVEGGEPSGDAKTLKKKRRRRFARRENPSSSILIIGVIIGAVLLGGLFLIYGGKKQPPKKPGVARPDSGVK